ncbi:MAG TPA: Flp family type IVb pilin [Actinomycetota bacterium]|nr:Flp family type IVb pilin [Actinomycetota bacterium]
MAGPKPTEEGATAVEYALIASLIAAVIAAVVATMGNQVLELLQSVRWW